LFKIHFLKSVTFQLYFLVIQDRHWNVHIEKNTCRLAEIRNLHTI
jgi:hypothetical protein